MNYWIFKCNPELYSIDERLNDKEPKTCWQVNQYKKAPPENGDVAFIWRTGPERGFVAVIDVVSEAKEMDELPHDEKYHTDKGRKQLLNINLRVLGRFKYKLNLIPSNKLREEYGLRNLSGIFVGIKMGTNFKITNNEGTILMDLCKKNINYTF